MVVRTTTWLALLQHLALAQPCQADAPLLQALHCSESGALGPGDSAREDTPLLQTHDGHFLDLGEEQGAVSADGEAARLPATNGTTSLALVEWESGPMTLYASVASSYNLIRGMMQFHAWLPDTKVWESWRDVRKSMLFIVPLVGLVHALEAYIKKAPLPEAFTDRISEAHRALARKILLNRMRPKMEPFLVDRGFTFEEVLDVVASIDSLEELKSAAADPGTFLLTLSADHGTIAARLLVLTVRPQIEPYVEQMGLVWADVGPILETVDSVEELQGALEDPKNFLYTLAQAHRPIARKLALAQIRKQVDAQLPFGLTWDDIKPILELVDSVEELKQAAQNPVTFMVTLAKAHLDVATAWFVLQLKGDVQEPLAEHGVAWEDAVPVLQELDQDAVKRAAADPATFYDSIASTSSWAGQQFQQASVRPHVSDTLESFGLSWWDVKPVIAEMDSVEEFEEAEAHPEAFVRRVASGHELVARKLLIHELRPRLELSVVAAGYTWEQVLPILTSVDTVRDVELAAEHPDTFFETLRTSNEQVDRDLALLKLHAQLKLYVEDRGLHWEDVLPLLRAATPEEIEGAVANSTLDFLAQGHPEKLRAWTLANLRPRLQEKLDGLGLEWADVTPIFAMATDFYVEAAPQGPGFMEFLAKTDTQIALRWGWVQLRPKLEPALRKQGVAWSDVETAVWDNADGDDMGLAARDPEHFFAMMAAKDPKVAHQFMMAQMRPQLEPLLAGKGLTWDDVGTVIDAVSSEKEIKRAKEDPKGWMGTVSSGAGDWWR